VPEISRGITDYLAVILGQVLHTDRLARIGQRLWAFAAKGPDYHYTYGRWRLEGRWHRQRHHFSALSDASFFAALALDRPELADVREKVSGGQSWSRHRHGDSEYRDAASSLVACLRARQRPKFHFAWQDRARILSAVEEHNKKATICAADEICQNTFRFRRLHPVRFEKGIDWTYCPDGNTDWTWDLNRHSYFVTLGKAYWYTGKETYADKFVELLRDWTTANPAGVGRQNWDSVLEIAVRINNWIWAFFFFLQADAFGRDEQIAFLKGLLIHARYLAARIERHAANNHLLLEAKALAFCGLLFPEFREAADWFKSGIQILWHEVERQVCADGVHAERAPLYHRRVLSDLLEMLVLLENNDLPVPTSVLERIERMVDFERHIAKPDGTIPLFSDSSLTEIEARFSNRGGGITLFDRIKLDGKGLDADMAWLLSNREPDRAAHDGYTTSTPRRDDGLVSRPFPQGGYYVMRSGRGQDGLYMAFDCGPFGYGPVPVHGHADALSLDLYAYGSTLITDCGAYSYHTSEDWRNYFRGTRAHNTVVVDGQDQSILLDTRYVLRQARATLHERLSSDGLDFVDGSHDGYERLAEPITHRRQILFVRSEYWVVVDTLTGFGRHCFDLYFHMLPGMDTQLDSRSRSLWARNGNGADLVIVPLATGNLQADIVTGNTAPIQGWVALYSGEKLPAPTLRYRQEGAAPVQFCTVLYPHPGKAAAGFVMPLDKLDRSTQNAGTRSNERPAVTVSALDIKADGLASPGADRLTGLCIKTDCYVDYLVLDRGPAGTRKFFAEYETDARLFYARHKADVAHTGRGDGDAVERPSEEQSPEKVAIAGGSQLLFQGKYVSAQIMHS
jgi:hypothetical protein